jgi:hypothetical protein
MKGILLLLLLFVACFSAVDGQQKTPEDSKNQNTTARELGSAKYVDPHNTDSKTDLTRVEPSDDDKTAGAPNPNAWYQVPDRKTRVRRYVKSVVGPVSLLKYAASAGITTARKTPSEWGSGWEGYGRRFANTMGKSAIRKTTMYALDEALKVDSTFYPSRNRSAGARLRNALFSPFTARDRRGRRVAGIPRVVGSVAAGVIPSEVWYPKRFNYTHGLKGAAISMGFNATFNIFREFIWKK